MPAAFERCVKAGGRVRTKTLSGRRYQRICWLDGKSHPGHVHTKKANLRRGRMGSAVMRKR